MTKFEKEINGGKFEKNTINCMILGFKNESFNAEINGKNFYEIDRKMLDGFEVDRTETLKQYFDHNSVDTFEIELENSQYIYFAPFTELIDFGFDRYVKALKNERYDLTEKLDRKYK